jgi:CMP-N,N'-diacetyllegionaminic acid synthase
VSILVTIPARAGSKGVKGKNMREFRGFSLTEYTILFAMPFGEVFLSTNIPDIENDSFYDGVSITRYERPPELCTDVALAWDVWQDAVKSAEAHFNKTWDIHLYLEPTSPCRTTSDIEECVKILTDSKKYNSVCTISETTPPYKMIKLGNPCVTPDYNGWMNNTPRQAYEPWYKKNGICYACTDKHIKESKTILDPLTKYVITKHPCVNIDSEADFILAEALMR